MSRGDKIVGWAILFVAAVMIRAAWFRQLEEQFPLAGVTMDETCFSHVLIGLEEEAIGLVADVLENYFYDRLKE